MYILVGSVAANKRISSGNDLSWYREKPLDIDYFTFEADVVEIRDQLTHTTKNKYYKHDTLDRYFITEYEIIDDHDLGKRQQSSPIFYDLVSKDPETKNLKFKVLLPTLNLLFTLKSSHRFLKNSPHFWKTAKDYHILKSLGCKIPEEAQLFLSVREKETYDYLHPKLTVSKNQFFTDTIKYVYDHDDIHEAVKLGSVPAYTKYQVKGEEVLCDKEAFFKLSLQERINGVLEEAYTLAIERSQLPFPETPPKRSFSMALSKICTSITSGWFREFAYENIFTILKQYSPDYINKFNESLRLNKVKRFQA